MGNETEKIKAQVAKLKNDLRKANDLLQASKKEYSTLKEEYQTANEELRQSNEELQKTNQFLEKSEQKYRSLFEGSRDGIVFLNPDGTFINCNDAYLRMLGYTYIELRQLDFYRLTPEKYHQWEKTEIVEKQLLQRGYSDTYEKEYIHKDGTIFPVEITGYKQENDAGKIIIWGVVRDISKRKTVENELKESQEMMSNILRASSVGLSLAINRKIIWANEAMEELFGYSYDEYHNQDTKILYADDLEYQRVGKLVYEKLQKNKPVRINTKFKRKDGSIFYGRYKINFIDPEQPEKGVIVSIINITDLIKTQQTLKENEIKLKLALEGANADTWELDLSEGTLNFSQSWAQRLGYEKGEINNTFQALLNLIHPDDIPENMKIFNDFLKNKNSETLEVEFRIRTKNNEYIWILARGKPVEWDDKIKPVRLIGTYFDITERKRVENELIEKEERYRFVTENIQEFIYMVDNQGTINFISGNTEKMFGFSFEQQKTSTVKQLFEQIHISDELKTDIYSKFKLAVKEKKKSSIYGFPLQIQEETHYFETLERLLYDDKDNFSGTIGVVRDITDRKRAEQELIKAKEEAEESNRLKTAFLHNISHEFRTPMNGIVGFSDLLTDPDIDAEQREYYAASIKESCNKLVDIVTDTIEISQIQSNDMKVYLSGTNLKNLVEKIIEDVRPKADNKFIELHYINYCEGEDMQITTDRQKVYRSLRHIVENAIKFTTKGSVEVSCAINEENVIQFTVKDTGIGISPEKLDIIFEPFRQLETSITSNPAGSGIGLSIAKAFMEMLGGNINVSSGVNKGTTVILTLPREQAGITDKKESSQDSTSKIKGKTILIVEDEMSNFMYLNEILKQESIHVKHAKNGREAIDMCRNNASIDLILMDIKMPVVDGFEATGIIKEFRSDIPVIAQTAYATQTDQHAILNKGFDDYISKPIKRKSFLKLLKKYLS